MNNKENLYFYKGLYINFKLHHFYLYSFKHFHLSINSLRFFILFNHIHRKFYNLLIPMLQLMLTFYNKVHNFCYNEDILNFYKGLNIAFKNHHLHIMSLNFYHIHRISYNLYYPLLQLKLKFNNKVNFFRNNKQNQDFYMGWYIASMFHHHHIMSILMHHIHRKSHMHSLRIFLGLIMHTCYNKVQLFRIDK